MALLPQTEKNFLRPTANLIDMMRIIAAGCIVWYHNSFYFVLSGFDREIVDIFKALLISWALPFFYVTAISFAYRSFVRAHQASDLATRVVRLVRLIIIFIVVYEVPYVVWYGVSRVVGIPMSYLPFGIRFESFGSIIQSAAHAIWSVRDSPAYFLNHLIVLTISTYVVARYAASNRVRSRVVASLCVLALLGTLLVPDIFDRVSRWVLLNRLALTMGCAAIFYEISSAYVIPLSKQYINKSITAFLLAGGLIAVIGGLYVGGVSWYMLPAVGFLWLRDQRVALSSRWLERLSVYGRGYALGIFLWHYFFLIFFANIAKMFHPPGHNLFTFIVTTLAGFAAALAWVIICRRVRWLRFLVSL